MTRANEGDSEEYGVSDLRGAAATEIQDGVVVSYEIRG